MSSLMKNRPQLVRRFLQTARSPVSSSYAVFGVSGGAYASSTTSPWISHTLPLLSRAKPFAARLESKKNAAQTSSSNNDSRHLDSSLSKSIDVDSSLAQTKSSQTISNDLRRAKSSANAFSKALNDQKHSSASSTETHKLQSLTNNKQPDWARATSKSINTNTMTRPTRKFRPRKAAITFTDNAVAHVKQLLNGPNPKLLKIGVKNRGCSGLTYNLEYVDQPGPFDEEVVQDGVKVLIDSKALFSIIGSEMDFQDNKLSSRFVFNNPNSKGQCGCGESFMV